jgi:hypothetical protein
MSRVLGTVAGWERAKDWTVEHRMYEGDGPNIDYIVEGEAIRTYSVSFDVALLFCESPPGLPVVVRTLYDTRITQEFDKIPIPEFKRWVSDMTNGTSADIHRQSIVEMGGTRDCGRGENESWIIEIKKQSVRIGERYLSKDEIEDLPIYDKLAELDEREENIDHRFSTAEAEVLSVKEERAKLKEKLKK